MGCPRTYVAPGDAEYIYPNSVVLADRMTIADGVKFHRDFAKSTSISIMQSTGARVVYIRRGTCGFGGCQLFAGGVRRDAMTRIRYLRAVVMNLRSIDSFSVFVCGEGNNIWGINGRLTMYAVVLVVMTCRRYDGRRVYACASLAQE